MLKYILEFVAGVILLVVLAALFRARQGAGGRNQKKNPADAYFGLRQQALTLSPDAIGMTVPPGEPFGVLMESRMGSAVVTLLALVDGTASLYFSNGGGIIGAGMHEAVATAAKRLIKTAKYFTSQMEPITSYPQPEAGQARFYVLTPEAVLTYQAPENDLGTGKSDLSSLFRDAHNVIGAIRVVDEKKRK